MKRTLDTEVGGRAGASLAEIVALAATPLFAVMSVLSAIGGGPIKELCSAAGASNLLGMTTMYGLMSAVHVSPWLKLLFGKRVGG